MMVTGKNNNKNTSAMEKGKTDVIVARTNLIAPPIYSDVKSAIGCDKRHKKYITIEITR